MVPYKKSESGGFLIEAILVLYLIVSILFSGIWLFRSLFQENVSTLYPSINLAITLLLCTGWGIKLFFEAVDGAAEGYGKLTPEEREKVDRVGKKVGVAIFSLLKERKDWLGELCKKIDEQK
ncbi:MAG: hypothetical protein WAV73_05745 [Candidatus Moraniibacteriota bacterium]